MKKLYTSYGTYGFLHQINKNNLDFGDPFGGGFGFFE